MCAFQLFIPVSTSDLLLETEQLSRIITLLADSVNRPSAHLLSMATTAYATALWVRVVSVSSS